MPPISKLPFLNIMTEVLLMQVPVTRGKKIGLAEIHKLQRSINKIICGLSEILDI